MMRKMVLPAIVGGLMVAAPVHAVFLGQATSDSQPDNVKHAAKPKKVCRSTEVIGSNLPHTECHTALEWKQIDKAPGMDESDMQRMRSQMVPHL